MAHYLDANSWRFQYHFFYTTSSKIFGIVVTDLSRFNTNKTSSCHKATSIQGLTTLRRLDTLCLGRFGSRSWRGRNRRRVGSSVRGRSCRREVAAAAINTVRKSGSRTVKGSTAVISSADEWGWSRRRVWITNFAASICVAACIAEVNAFHISRARTGSAALIWTLGGSLGGRDSWIHSRFLMFIFTVRLHSLVLRKEELKKFMSNLTLLGALLGALLGVIVGDWVGVIVGV